MLPAKILSCRNISVGTPSLISLLESCRTVRQALQIQAQVFLRGLHHHKFTLSKLISFFAFSGLDGFDQSRRLLLSQFTETSTFDYNNVIRGYSGSDSPIGAVVLFKSMISQGCVVPNNFTFPFLVNCCAKLPDPEFGLEIHCRVVKHGFDSDTFIANSLIHYYISFADLDSARQMFDESLERDVVSYNTMINGYARNGRATDVLVLFKAMRVSGLIPDEYTFVSLVSVCSFLGDPKTGKLIHQVVCKNFGFDSFGVLLKNAFVDMYAKCELMNMADRVFRTIESSKSVTALTCMVSGYARCREIEVAHRYFNVIPEKDLISWTAMIEGYSQIGRYEDALGLFKEMRTAGIKADEVNMAIVLSACAQLGALCVGKKLHHYVETMSVNRSPLVNTALVDMYAKCGCIETALSVFNGVDEKSKTLCLFNSIISGLAQHGLGKVAISFFKGMEELALSPDEVTFVGVLCACSHSGLIEDGKEIFYSMVEKYGIRPQIEHYGCMVDLLGRGGLLVEACDFIKKMPIGANSIIWLSLLGACRIHRNVKIAEIAGNRLLELDPNHGGRSVLLSGILSNEKRWDDAREARKLKAYKPPGWSYIEWNGSLHHFQANDKSHPQAKEIDLKLEEMTRLLRSAGHVPDTEQVSFDIQEEEKESLVNYHSEKLALAYGLINMEPRKTIRIVKNIRICNDCHMSLKFLSGIYSRQIIVRDRIRFHHMKAGLCSCGDYW